MDAAVKEWAMLQVVAETYLGDVKYVGIVEVEDKGDRTPGYMSMLQDRAHLTLSVEVGKTLNPSFSATRLTLRDEGTDEDGHHIVTVVQRKPIEVTS